MKMVRKRREQQERLIRNYLLAYLDNNFVLLYLVIILLQKSNFIFIEMTYNITTRICITCLRSQIFKAKFFLSFLYFEKEIFLVGT